jgi:EmrB/QacA subfamily drug resistance transporter
MITKAQRSIALLVAGCFFMENLDGTIVTTAAPRIGADLHVPSSAVGLVITVYLMTLAVLIPLSGWMTARFGTRKVFLAAIVTFTVASALCSASGSLGELVVMRVLQGAGGAMMVPVGRLAVLAKAAKQDMMRIVAYIVWPGLVAPVIAPLAGGLITTYASWRWLFLINVPLGIIALLTATRLLPATPTAIPTATSTATSTTTSTTTPPLDVTGVILTCAGLAGLTWCAHLLSTPAVSWAPTVLIGAASLVLLIATVRHLLRTANPLIDVRTLRIPSLRASVVGGSLFWIMVGAAPFLLPLLFQNIFGWSPVKSGAVVLFIFVGNIGIKPATTFLINRFGFRAVLTAATAMAAATMLGAACFTATMPLLIVILVTMLSGVARSVGLSAYTTLAFSDVPDDQMRHANTLNATSQQLCAGLGVAVAAVALRAGLPASRLFTPHPSVAAAYTFAFVMLALIALTATAGALRLHPQAGNSVRAGTTTPQGGRPESAPPAVQNDQNDQNDQNGHNIKNDQYPQNITGNAGHRITR